MQSVEEESLVSNAAFTKLMIAQGLKRLLKTTSFATLSVGDIAQECHISRNTFYYHFKDKYDLISWIFYTETTSILSDDISLEHWGDSLLALCRYMQENRDFYLNILEFHGQNSFTECLLDFYQGLVGRLLFQSNTQFPLSSRQIRTFSRFYAYGITGVIMDWARNGMTADPEPPVNILEKLLSCNTVHKILFTQSD